VRNRLAKKSRKVDRMAAKAALETLPDADLVNLTHELGRAVNQKGQEVTELRGRLDMVRRERERRETSTSIGPHISDHAVLRYLERYKGIDTKLIREEIAFMAKRSGKLDTGDQYIRHRDEQTGITMGINGDSNTVTTVFTEHENGVFPKVP
jgi:hypothetical protein